MSASPCPELVWRLYEGAIPTDCELREVNLEWALSVVYRGKSVFRARYGARRAAIAHAEVLRANLLANGWRTRALASQSDATVESGGHPAKLYRVLIDRVG